MFSKSKHSSALTCQAQRFNAQEAAEWISSRYQAVMDEFEKQKTSETQCSLPLNYVGMPNKPLKAFSHLGLHIVFENSKQLF